MPSLIEGEGIFTICFYCPCRFPIDTLPHAFDTIAIFVKLLSLYSGLSTFAIQFLHHSELGIFRANNFTGRTWGYLTDRFALMFYCK